MKKRDPITESVDRIVAALLARARRRPSEPTNLDLFERITDIIRSLPPAKQDAALEVLHEHLTATLAQVEALARPRPTPKRR